VPRRAVIMLMVIMPMVIMPMVMMVMVVIVTMVVTVMVVIVVVMIMIVTVMMMVVGLGLGIGPFRLSRPDRRLTASANRAHQMTSSSLIRMASPSVT